MTIVCKDKFLVKSGMFTYYLSLFVFLFIMLKSYVIWVHMDKINATKYFKNEVKHHIYLLVFHLLFCSYGLPVDFQAVLIQPNKKSQKRLRDVLRQLYNHLDGSSASLINDVSCFICLKLINFAIQSITFY